MPKNTASGISVHSRPACMHYCYYRLVWPNKGSNWRPLSCFPPDCALLTETKHDEFERHSWATNHAGWHWARFLLTHTEEPSWRECLPLSAPSRSLSGRRTGLAGSAQRAPNQPDSQKEQLNRAERSGALLAGAHPKRDHLHAQAWIPCAVPCWPAPAQQR